jgi:hypothetical protein
LPKEVDLVGKALEELKKHFEAKNLSPQQWILYNENTLKLSQTLVNALEAERNSKAVASKPEPKIDIKELIPDDMRKKYESRMEESVEELKKQKAQSIWKDVSELPENDHDILFKFLTRSLGDSNFLPCDFFVRNFCFPNNEKLSILKKCEEPE